MNVRAALAPALVAVLLTGCVAGQEQDVAASAPDSPSATPSAAVESSAAPSATSNPTSSPTPAARTIAVSYAGGEVTGTRGREEVAVGEDVVLRLSSDVAEEVHVHGYDLSADIPAGGSVDIPVTASIPGVFEVELHDSGKVLFQLRVA